MPRIRGTVRSESTTAAESRNGRGLRASPRPCSASHVAGFLTASFAAVLAHAFPRETFLLNEMVAAAGLSRLYGGLHYRFDITAGEELGFRVGEWAIAHDARWHQPFPLD